MIGRALSLLVLIALGAPNAVAQEAWPPDGSTLVRDSARIEFGGVSVAPPLQGAWASTVRTDFGGYDWLVFGERPDASGRGGTTLLTVRVGWLGPDYARPNLPRDSIEVLYDRIVASFRAEHSAEGMTLESFESAPDSIGRAPCRRYAVSTLDARPAEDGSPRSYTELARGLVCVHPGDRSRLIDLSATQRSIALDSVPDRTGVMARFLDAARFTPFRAVTRRAIKMPGRPRGIAAGNGALWVGVYDSNRVVRVDATSNRAVASVRVTSPIGIAVGPGAVWIASSLGGTVVRIDPASNRMIAEIKTGKGPVLVALGAGSVWVSNWDDATVARIDPVTNRLAAPPIRVPAAPSGVAELAGLIWVASYECGCVSRIDPRTNQLVGDPIATGRGAQDLIVAAGALWVANAEEGTIARIDPMTARVTATIKVGTAAIGLAVTGDTLWVGTGTDASVRAIDLRTSQPSALPIATFPGVSFLAAAAGSLWIPSLGDVVTRIAIAP